MNRIKTTLVSLVMVSVLLSCVTTESQTSNDKTQPSYYLDVSKKLVIATVEQLEEERKKHDNPDASILPIYVSIFSTVFKSTKEGTELLNLIIESKPKNKSEKNIQKILIAVKDSHTDPKALQEGAKNMKALSDNHYLSVVGVLTLILSDVISSFHLSDENKNVDLIKKRYKNIFFKSKRGKAIAQDVLSISIPFAEQQPKSTLRFSKKALADLLKE